MRHNDYKAMIHAQEQTYLNAYAYIFQNWACSTWQAIPQGIKLTLVLHGSLGMCNGQLVTRAGAQGMSEFIQRMNRIR